MLKCIIMTYLIVGNKEKNIKEGIEILLKKLWGRDINEDLFSGKIPDIHILYSKNVKSIGIEDVKNFQREMMFTPYKELVQVAIIFNAEKLTLQAQNSFLKTLEESSDTTAYILATSNEGNLLPTVISRCFKFYTKEEKTEIVQCDNILELDLLRAFERIEGISKDRNDTLLLLEYLESHLQTELESKIGEGVDVKNTSESINRVINARKKVKANGNRRLILESLYLDLTRQIAS